MSKVEKAYLSIWGEKTEKEVIYSWTESRFKMSLIWSQFKLKKMAFDNCSCRNSLQNFSWLQVDMNHSLCWSEIKGASSLLDAGWAHSLVTLVCPEGRILRRLPATQGSQVKCGKVMETTVRKPQRKTEQTRNGTEKNEELRKKWEQSVNSWWAVMYKEFTPHFSRRQVEHQLEECTGK